MTCTLIVCDKIKKETQNPSPEEIEQAIDCLIPVMDQFVILEPELPVGNCAYIQTLIVKDKSPEIKYTLEARFEYSDKFTHLQRFVTDGDELKKIFRMFAHGVVPNTDGWTDMTAEFIGGTG